MSSHKKKEAQSAKNTFALEHADYSTFVKKIKGVLFDYGQFFEKIKVQASLNKSLAYFLLIVLIYLVIVSLVYAIMYNPAKQAVAATEAITAAVILGFAVSILFLFVSATLVYATAHMFKGTGTYAQTVTVISFGSTPTYLLGWVPLLGLLAIAYSVIIQIKGIAVMHDLPQGKASASILIPLALILLMTALVLLSLGINPFVVSGKAPSTA